MPQAVETITVHLAEPPVGIFRDACEARPIDIIGQVLTRLGQISALARMMAASEELGPAAQNAMRGIETFVDDTIGLLTVIPVRGAA
jgi:hypothetical protein